MQSSTMMRRKLQIVRNEPNIKLFLNHRMIDAKTEDATIRSVVAQHTHSGKRMRISGKTLPRCNRDGVLGAKAGADY